MGNNMGGNMRGNMGGMGNNMGWYGRWNGRRNGWRHGRWNGGKHLEQQWWKQHAAETRKHGNGWRKQMGRKPRKQFWWWKSRWVQTRLPWVTEVGRQSEGEQQRYGWRNEGEEVL